MTVITSKELAALCGVSHRRARQFVNEGRLPSLKLAGLALVDAEAAYAFAAARKTPVLSYGGKSDKTGSKRENRTR